MIFEATHHSYLIDGFLISVVSKRIIRMCTYQNNYEKNQKERIKIPWFTVYVLLSFPDPSRESSVSLSSLGLNFVLFIFFFLFLKISKTKGTDRKTKKRMKDGFNLRFLDYLINQWLIWSTSVKILIKKKLQVFLLETKR